MSDFDQLCRQYLKHERCAQCLLVCQQPTYAVSRGAIANIPFLAYARGVGEGRWVVGAVCVDVTWARHGCTAVDLCGQTATHRARLALQHNPVLSNLVPSNHHMCQVALLASPLTTVKRPTALASNALLAHLCSYQASRCPQNLLGSCRWPQWTEAGCLSRLHWRHTGREMPRTHQSLRQKTHGNTTAASLMQLATVH